MKKILLDSLISFSYYELDINIIFIIDIIISLVIVFIFNLNIRERVKFLLNLVFRSEDKAITFNLYMKNLWEKVLTKNRNQHFNFFILVNFLLVLAFLFKKEWEIKNLFITIILSAILFIVSCAITKKRLINYRENNLKGIARMKAV